MSPTLRRICTLGPILVLFLSACANPSTSTPPDLSFDERLQNPFFAERYWDEMAAAMADLRIQKDPILQEEEKAAIADRARESAIELSRLAREKRRSGIFGLFVPVNADTTGYALLLENILYLSTTFETSPGPSLYVFLTTDVDPRDVEFPNDRALSLGSLHSPYGAQSYALPENTEDPGYRTVMLWDTKLERLYGFAQLSK